MCRDGFREKCARCWRIITCRDDYPVCEWCLYGDDGPSW